MGIFQNPTPEQKDEIIKKIKDHVDHHHNCRVGWAAKEVLKAPTFPATLDKLAAEVAEDTKYKKERNGTNDWNIVKNLDNAPSTMDKWIKGIAIVESILIIVSIPIGLYMQSNSNRLEQENKQLTDTLAIRDNKINSLDELLKNKNKEVIELRQTLDTLTKKLEVKKK